MTPPQTVASDPFAAFPPLARWALTRLPLDEAIHPHLDPRQSLDEVYALCLAQPGSAPDAIRLLVSVLPVRESVWWAWVSARHAMQQEGAPPPSPEVHTAVAAIEQWIVRPDEDNRRDAWAAGEAAGVDTPAGMVAAAVFLGGQSVAPPNLPPVPPPPGATLPLIAGAVLLSAAAVADGPRIAATLEAFAAQGLEIVRRLGGWDAAAQMAYDTHQRTLQEYGRLTGGS